MGKYWFPACPAHYIILPPWQSWQRCRTFASSISQALALSSNLARQCIIQQLPKPPCHIASASAQHHEYLWQTSMLLLQIYTHTHTRRSFAHFQHSWDVFVWVIPSCHSQLWIPSCPDTEPILKWFSHQASVWDKDLLEQTKNHLYPQSASSEFQLGRKEAGNRRSKFLSVHECWDPFFQAAHTLQFVVLTGAGGWSSRSSK